jgi:hypothetical protein
LGLLLLTLLLKLISTVFSGQSIEALPEPTA